MAPRVVADLPFKGINVEGSQKYRRWERVPWVGSRGEKTIIELINSCFESSKKNICRQMMPDVWNIA